MSLLTQAREMGALPIIKFANPGDGVEGKLLYCRKFTGQKFTSFDFVLEVGDDDAKDESKERIKKEKAIVRVSEGTVLFNKIVDAGPTINGRIAILFNGQPPGKNYKSWTVLCSNNGGEPVKLTEEKKEKRPREPGDDDDDVKW